MNTARVLASRELLIAQLKHRKALGLLPRRRGRVPRQAQPDQIRVDYYAMIRKGINAPMKQALESALLPELPALLRDAAQERGDAGRFDAGPGDKVNRIIERVARDFAANLTIGNLEQYPARFAPRASAFQRRQLHRQITASIGTDVFIADARISPALDHFVSENAALIKTVPERYFSSIQKDTMAALRTGARAETLQYVIQNSYNVSESNAARIARDQIGKLNGQLNGIRQQALGVSGYYWRGMMDNRERDSHEILEGRYYTWRDGGPEGNPGDPINCRCYGEPDFSPILDSL